jgi:hypothetical protein
VWSAWSLSSRCFRNSRRRVSSSTGTQTDSPSGSRAGRVRRSLVLAVAAGTAVASLALIGLGTATVASAAPSGAPGVSQCNPPETPIAPALQETCIVTVVNTTSASGATSSTTTTSSCLAAPGVYSPSCPLSLGPNLGPIVTVLHSNQLVTSVNQCNNITEVGGSNVYCNVNVVNDVPVGTPTAAVTVDQCIGSATTSTENCNPTSSTSGATVTQCNGSATGGGNYAGQFAVGCTVTGGTSALPVTVTQCNNTAIGAGSSVTCMAAFRNNFVTPTTPTLPTGTAGSGTASAGGGTGGTSGAGGAGTTETTPATPGGSGATGLTGNAAGAGGSTGPPTIVGTLGAIPSGAPQTGFGGASRSHDSDFLYAGTIALIGAGLALTIAIRRRRTLSLHGANEAP